MFAAFIKKEYFEEYLTEYLSVVQSMNIPLMKLFSHLTYEQLREMTRQGVQNYLEGFEHGTALEQAAESLRKWETDELPGVPKNAIESSDLVLVYAAQKLTLNKFLTLYTDDVHTVATIVRELEEYYIQVQDQALQMLFRLQKATEEKLADKNRQLEEAQALAHIGSWEYDARTNTSIVSTELYHIFGLEPQEGPVDANLFREMMNMDPTNESQQAASFHYALGLPYFQEFTITRSNGEKRILQTRGESILDEKGKVIKAHGTTQDITEIREAEIQKQLSQQKDEFISIASHELKTPLTSLKAYVQLIDKTLSSDSASMAGKYVAKAMEFTGKLEALISDLLDVSKIEAGKLQFNMQEFEIDQLVQDCIEMTRHSAPDYQITLHGSSGATMKADRQRIEQVLLNYLSNAVKYSPKNKQIEVYIHLKDKQVEVAVQDFGIGIPAPKQNRIFERFFRVQNKNHNFQGLGIGLYISAEIVKRHKGKVWVKSEEGKGSTFSFSLPVK